MNTLAGIEKSIHRLEQHRVNMPDTNGIMFSEAAVDLLLPWLDAFLKLGTEFKVPGLITEMVAFFWEACTDQLDFLKAGDNEIGINGAERVISKLEACGATIE